MNNMPLVSIGVLTYNHENYIKDCLDSILEQDYPNIELIILDDASSDQTASIVDAYLPRLKGVLSRVVFIKNKRNCGNIPHNVNCMIKQIHGKFYKDFSGDDIMTKGCISALAMALINNPQYSLVYSNGYEVNDKYEKGRAVGYRNCMIKNHNKDSENIFNKLLVEDNFIPAPGVLLKSDLFHKYGLFDEKIAIEDYEYWLRISRDELFLYIPDKLFYYRRTVNSLSNYSAGQKKQKVKRAIKAQRDVKNKYLKYLNENERKRCKIVFYRKFLSICCGARYYRGIITITYKLKKYDPKFNFFKCLFLHFKY